MRQVRWPLIVGGVRICAYVADFRVVNNDGADELFETKGYETPEWKIKHKLFRALYPNVKLTVVKV